MRINWLPVVACTDTDTDTYTDTDADTSRDTNTDPDTITDTDTRYSVCFCTVCGVTSMDGEEDVYETKKSGQQASSSSSSFTSILINLCLIQ